MAVTTPFKKLQHQRSKQVEVIKEYSRQYGVFGLQVSIRTCIFFFIFSFCGYSSISYISSCGKQRVKLRGGKALRRTLVWVLHFEKLQHQRPNQVEVIKEYSRQYSVFGLWISIRTRTFFLLVSFCGYSSIISSSSSVSSVGKQQAKLWSGKALRITCLSSGSSCWPESRFNPALLAQQSSNRQVLLRFEAAYDSRAGLFIARSASDARCDDRRCGSIYQQFGGQQAQILGWSPQFAHQNCSILSHLI